MTNTANNTSDFTDVELEALWIELGNIPVNQDDALEDEFRFFPAGTPRLEVWDWFDTHYSKGVAALSGSDSTTLDPDVEPKPVPCTDERTCLNCYTGIGSCISTLQNYVVYQGVAHEYKNAYDENSSAIITPTGEVIVAPNTAIGLGGSNGG
ncbi:MAG: hypothetical protein RR280_08525 [Bacteroidaceae bacterium]